MLNLKLKNNYMRLSKYTFLFPDQQSSKYYIYNTLSNTLMNIDIEIYNVLLECKKNNRKFIKEKIDEELYKILEEKRFIVDNDKDEFLLYKSILQSQRSDSTHMHLTIAPTMDCNFSCHYCFEKKEKNYINSDTIDSLIKYLETKNNIESIFLTWFGGEPLMAIEQIKEFYTKFKKVWKKDFKSNIITTGYHITPEVIAMLKEVEISSIQITLDGDKSSHNRIKYLDESTDVFSHIINNLELIEKYAPEIHVTIRVNISKENAKEYVGLYSFLKKKLKKIGIAPAFVKNRSKNNCDLNNYYFNRQESSQFIIDLIKKHNIHSPWITYPSRFFEECAIRNKNSLALDPDGYVYKCWEIIGNKQYAVGKLIDGEIKDINYTMLNRQMYGADPIEDKICSKCSYLPICNGGCPIQRIENEFENGNNDICTFYKGFLPEFMRIHLALKKTGFKNYR